MTKKLIIAIDGPAGSGKSTVSKILAKRISYTYLDTGALYRAVAYRVLKEGIAHGAHGDETRLSQLCGRIKIGLKTIDGDLRVFVDDEDVTDRIRTEDIGVIASTVSAMPVVRETLLSIQREMGENGGIVAEGRDMGTVVFPHADLKFFFNADVSERAKRRFLELKEKGIPVDFDEIRESVLQRDRQDMARDIAPLRVPSDAIVIDTTSVTAEEVIDTIAVYIEKALDREV